MDDFDDDFDSVDADIPDVRRPPAVWPVFVAFAIVFVAIIVSQVFVVAVWAAWEFAQGNIAQFAQDLADFVTTPAGFSLIASAGQICVVIGAFAGAWFFRPSLGDSLGLTTPSVAWWSYPILALSVVGPGMLGLLLAESINTFLPLDRTFDQICARLGWIDGTLFTLFIALAPGFCEELFFRGYMQRRLLQAWPAWAAIFVTSLLFGVLHMNPAQGAFAIILGLWLGVLAWRTGSVWPSVMCHALWNGGSVIAGVLASRFGIDDLPIIPAIAAAGVGLVFTTLAVVILFMRPVPPREDEADEVG